MTGIVVVAFIVSCSSDLLHCKTLYTEPMKWRTAEACNQELPRLKRSFESAGYVHVMAKCRYLMPKRPDAPYVG